MEQFDSQVYPNRKTPEEVIYSDWSKRFIPEESGPYLLDLYQDLFIIIANFLSDRDKIMFFSTCKRLNVLKKVVKYKTYIRLSKIKKLPYYDNFINIIATGSELNSLRKRSRCLPDGVRCLVLENFKGHLPTHIRHLRNLTSLTLKPGCKINITHNCLPRTLSHLTWGTGQPITTNFLPEGLISLRLENYYQGSNHIPVLPDKLVSLYVATDCSVNIDGSNLTNLRKLEVHCREHKFSMKLPDNLEKLILGRNAKKLEDFTNAGNSTNNLNSVVLYRKDGHHLKLSNNVWDSIY